MENHEKIYQILMELKEQNGSQTSKLENIEKKLDFTNGKVAKSMEKISVLENWRWYIMGCLAVLSLTGVVYFKYHVAQTVDSIFENPQKLKSLLSEAGYDTIIIENK